jgi:multisubunit Na+/H+ antiporter MnhG subunit
MTSRKLKAAGSEESEPLKGSEKARAKNDFRSWLAIVLSVVVTLLGLGYLLAVAFGKIGANRFGTTEGIIFVAILLLNSTWAQRIGRLAISGKGIEFQMREVQEEQVRQRADIGSIKFLLSYFVTEQELEHLQRLAGKIPSDYTNADDWHHGIFKTELRRLRSLGLIRMHPGRMIEPMPKKDDLNKHCRITDRGLEYLKLREEVESQD